MKAKTPDVTPQKKLPKKRTTKPNIRPASSASKSRNPAAESGGSGLIYGSVVLSLIGIGVLVFGLKTKREAAGASSGQAFVISGAAVLVIGLALGGYGLTSGSTAPPPKARNKSPRKNSKKRRKKSTTTSKRSTASKKKKPAAPVVDPMKLVGELTVPPLAHDEGYRIRDFAFDAQCRMRIWTEAGESLLFDADGARVDAKRGEPNQKPPIDFRLDGVDYRATLGPRSVITREVAVKDDCPTLSKEQSAKIAAYWKQGGMAKSVATYVVNRRPAGKKGIVFSASSVFHFGDATIVNQRIRMFLSRRRSFASPTFLYIQDGAIKHRGAGRLEPVVTNGETYYLLKSRSKLEVKREIGGPALWKISGAREHLTIPRLGHVAIWDLKGCRILDVKDGTVVQKVPQQRDFILHGSASNDGRFVAFAYHGAVKILKAPSYQVVYEQTLRNRLNEPKDFRFCSKGDHLFWRDREKFGDHDSLFQVWSAIKGEAKPYPAVVEGFRHAFRGMGTLDLAAGSDGETFFVRRSKTLREWRIDFKNKRMVPVRLPAWECVALKNRYAVERGNMNKRGPDRGALVYRRLPDLKPMTNVRARNDQTRLAVSTKLIAFGRKRSGKEERVFDIISRENQAAKTIVFPIDSSVREAWTFKDLAGFHAIFDHSVSDPTTRITTRQLKAFDLSGDGIREIDAKPAGKVLSPEGNYVYHRTGAILRTRARETRQMITKFTDGSLVLKFEQVGWGRSYSTAFSADERLVAFKTMGELVVGDLKKKKIIARKKSEPDGKIIFISPRRLLLLEGRDVTMYELNVE